MDIADAKYVTLTTYRKSGAAVSSPVWIVALGDGRVGFYTAMGSGKTKRIKNDPHVTIQAANFKGTVKPGSKPVKATAELVQSGPLYDEVRRAIVAKYGFVTKLAKWAGAIPMRRQGLTYADTAVLLRLDGNNGA